MRKKKEKQREKKEALSVFGITMAPSQCVGVQNSR